MPETKGICMLLFGGSGYLALYNTDIFSQNYMSSIFKKLYNCKHLYKSCGCSKMLPGIEGMVK